MAIILLCMNVYRWQYDSQHYKLKLRNKTQALFFLLILSSQKLIERFSNQKITGIFDDTWSRMESILLCHRFIAFLLQTTEDSSSWWNKQMWFEDRAESGSFTYRICIAIVLMRNILWKVCCLLVLSVLFSSPKTRKWNHQNFILVIYFWIVQVFRPLC